MKYFQNFFEPKGRGSFKGDKILPLGKSQSQETWMEHEGGIGKERILTAVDGVSQNGAADVLHVNTNLMGAASF